VERDQALHHLAEAHAAHATEALADGNLVDSGLYAAASLALEERPDTRGAALAALSAGLPVLQWEVAIPPELAGSLDPSTRIAGWRRDPRRACTALALSPDGRVAACGTPDGVLVIEDGVPRRVGAGAIGGLALDANGRLAVGMLDGGPTQIWDLSGGLLATVPGPRNATWTVSWLPDGRVVTTGGDGDVRVDGEVVTSFGPSLSNHAVSADGRWVLLPFGHLRSLVGEPNRNLQPFIATWTAAFSPEGRAIAGASWLGDADISLWDADGVPTGTISGHRGVVRSLAFAAEDRLLSASEDGTVGHWPLSDHGLKQHAHDGGLTDLKVAGDVLVTAGRDLRVRGWRLDPAPWGAQRVTGLPSTIGIVGTTVGSVGQDTTLRRWDLRTGAALPPQQILTWGPYLDCGDGRPTVAGHAQVVARLDPYVQVTHTVEDREQTSVDCDAGVIHLLERSDDPDHSWLRWRSVDAETGATLDERDVPGGTSTLVAERGRVILGGASIAPVEWTGGVARPLPASGSGALAVGPDGVLAAGGADGFVTLLPGSRRIAAHAGEVRAVAITPDGTMMATAGRDGATRLWSLPDGVLLAEWRIPPTNADSLVFEADGQTLWVAFVDGTLRPLRLHHLTTDGDALADLLGARTGMRLDGGRVVAR
jgi:WD40 repeat protein